MDPTLIAVLVTLLADIVAKVVSSKKANEQVKEMGEAVKGLKVLQEQQIQMSSAINRRVEVLEHRVAYLENYRPSAEQAAPDEFLDSSWPPHRKRGSRH